MKVKTLLVEKARRLLRREDGTQMVEVAIAIPLMMVLLAGATEFGRFFYTYSTLKTAVRAGARHASKWRSTDSWTIPETRNIVVYGDFSDKSKGAILPGLKESNVTVTPNGPANRVESVTVSISGYRYVPLFDIGKLTGISALSLDVDVKPSVTMKQLFNGPVAQ